ncbi:MAG TPA: hypothetical protein VFR33_06120 [Candidatus Dormibacteraeota bacterium]|nr:hypothetical protein [Candidatus Dormibacteraeota bacterium]
MSTSCPAGQAADGMEVERCRGCLAPPDRHMLIDRDGTVRLSQTELAD